MSEIEECNGDKPDFERIGGEVYPKNFAGVNHENIMDEVSFLFKTYFRDKKCIVRTNSHLKVRNVTETERENLKYEDYKTIYELNKEVTDKDYFIPDLFVLCGEESFITVDEGYIGIPKLVVEVVSKSTKNMDYGKKREVYVNGGVDEYWLIDIYEKKIIVWRNGVKEEYVYPSVVRAKVFDGLEVDFSKIRLRYM